MHLDRQCGTVKRKPLTVFYQMRIYLAIIFFSVYSCKPAVDYPLKGYPYPVFLSAVDTANFIFPLKDSLSTRDSLESTDYRLLFTAFDEPNLSIRPQPKPVYRMLYSSVMERSVVLTLTEDQITIKEQTKGYNSLYFDTSKLTPLERTHYMVLREHFPVQEVPVGWRKKYIDSLVSIYPQLLDILYYQRLREKAMTFGEEPFAYKTEVIPISQRTYSRLANAINSSDFWEEPYYRDCNNAPMDGDGFTLEVNTPERYKVVKTSFCPGYSRSFHKAWQQLAEYIKWGERLNLMWQDS